MQPFLKQRLREGLLIFACACALFLWIALLTYHHTDMIRSAHIANSSGKAGLIFAKILFDGFGYVAYLFPAALIHSAWSGYRGQVEIDTKDYLFLTFRACGYIAIFLAICGLAGMHGALQLPDGAGGIIGIHVANNLVSLLNFSGASLFLLALLLSGITLSTGISWLDCMDKTGYGAIVMLNFIKLRYQTFRHFMILRRETIPAPAPPQIDLKRLGHRELPRIEPEIHRQEIKKEKEKEKPVQQLPLVLRPAPVTGTLPSIDLLDPAEKPTGKGFTNDELEQLSRNVELRLLDFGIEVHVVAVHPGPVVTRFEMELAAGVKVSRITTLAKDLARSLSAISVRVVEVIPGKAVVGLELPNKHREIVRLCEVIACQQYEQARSPLSLALGKDIAGHPVVVDLAKMPHLLVAGTTGSGKSVGLNAMLLSLLYKATAEEVRMIMIDPKMLELSIYDNIPHLLAPVVTDMKEAANALRWCVAEMDRRYRLMATLGVRNLAGYNQKIEEAQKKGQPLLDPLWKSEMGDKPAELFALPYIVVVVDEFADMIMVVGKKVEELIARIAQKARAAGIHLILATQRPSVDVITGLIKANIPTRIAFQVSSKIDSRTILDQQGAEQLLGYGDMLYLPPGTGLPVRVHGAFVADHEVHGVVEDLKKRGTPDYITSITEGNEELSGADAALFGATADSDTESDPFYDQAVQIVLETRRASISQLQRRLRIGYNRAATLVEQMEKAGLVGPMELNGNREILVPVSME